MFRVILAALACAWASVAAAAPLSAYGKLPEFEDAAISPSGNAVAMIATNGEKRAVIIRDVKTGEITSRTYMGDVKLRAIEWVGERHIMVVSSVTAAPIDFVNSRAEWLMGYILDPAAKKATPMLKNTTGPLISISSMPVARTFNGRPTVFVQGSVFKGYEGKLGLYRVDPETMRVEIVGDASREAVDWVVGVDGQPLAYEYYEAKSGRWSIHMKAPVGWHEVVSATAMLDPPSMIGQGRTPGSVLYVSKEDNVTAWREVTADGAPSQVVETSARQTSLRSPSDGSLIGYVRRQGDKANYTFFDPADAKNWRMVQSAFGGNSVTLASMSYDRRKFVVWVDSPTEGPAYAYVDTNTRQATWLGAAYGDLQEADIGEQRGVSYKAADGLDLSGYLTLPRGKEAKNLPLIVFPHGGPQAHDAAGFDWWAQAMASRGYAVLQVNFRGSDGQGEKFIEAGYGEWGRKMQTDLSDGVRYLAGKGLIDPKRVCIVGASYGGYAALAGAAFDGDVYRCAVSVAGVADLKRQVTYSRQMGGISSQRYWHRFMGAEDPNDPILAERSPALHVDKIKIPILLIHGQDDTVVHPDQSRIMAEALRKAGKPVEYVTQKGADHWLSRGDTRLQTLESLVAFVEKHNPPN